MTSTRIGFIDISTYLQLTEASYKTDRTIQGET